jgi:hypothetical protein
MAKKKMPPQFGKSDKPGKGDAKDAKGMPGKDMKGKGGKKGKGAC